MLQQTQVETVIPYYQRFIKRFNSVEQLAKSSQEAVLKVWEGLGYYTRARNLHRAAISIVENFNSALPSIREELMKLPGFGPYTTHAVLSLAFNQSYGVVDGNVKRVLSRLYAIEDDIRDLKTQRRIQELMDSLLPSKYPGEFNEAVMELGATICTLKSPLCSACPISGDCMARKNNLESLLPYRSKKATIPTNRSLACIVTHQDLFLVVKRPQHKMLAGLWEFPVLEIKNGYSVSDIDKSTILNQFNLKTSILQSWPAISHTYTHFHLKLYSKLFEADSSDFQSDFYDDYQWMGIDKIRKLPLHKAMWKVLNEIDKVLKVIP
jgi:A/G-specific adenine glycosylase